MLGAKTITSLMFLALAVVLTAVAGLLDVEHLSHLSTEACVVIGLFASLGGVLVGRFWQVDRPSHHYVGVRRGRRMVDESRLLGLGSAQLVMGSNAETTPRDMPATLQRASYGLIFLCIGLTAFTNRATALLTQVPTSLSSLSLSSYCAEEDETAAPEPKTKLVEAPGCALILRAYRLGYTKKLGNCAPKEVTEAAAKKRDVCRARQWDEPIIHYAWRLVDEKVSGAKQVSPTGTLGETIREFKIQLGYLEALIANQAHAVSSSPRSAHHIWTNLPDPRPASWLARTFSPESCTSRFSDFPVEVNWQNASKHSASRAAAAVFDHALGQLLFNPRFGPPPAYCREYTVHWNAPDDACKRLSAEPKRFLDSTGALDSVRDVISRHRRLSDVRALTADLGRKELGGPLPELQRVASFNCFMVDPKGTGAVSNTEVKVEGATLAVRELRGPATESRGAGQVEIYRRVAALLTGGTRYAGPMTEKPIERASAAPPKAEELAGADFPLTKLEALRESDAFVGAAWPLDVDHLVEVYPFHVHLQNFSDVFRRTYRAQRGRL